MQNFVDRLLLGYSWDGGWRRPQVDLASLYVDQFPKGDLARTVETFRHADFPHDRGRAHPGRLEVGGRRRPDHR